MATFLQYLMSGLMIGGVYSLIAVGFVLIYKSSRVLNFAQGEFVMLGGFVCFAFLTQFGLPLWVGFLVTFAIAAIAGLAVERTLMRPLAGQSLLSMVMMTILLSSLMVGIMNLFWYGHAGTYPPFLPQGNLWLGPVVISIQQLICFTLAILLIAFFSFFFQYTRVGLSMRSVAEDHQTAQSTGITINRVFAQSWAIAAVISAVGGILLGSMGTVNFSLNMLGLKALPVVLLGGLESIPGAVIGGLIVGVVETLAAGYFDPLVGGGLRDVVPFVLMLIILLFRPYGLFGLARIERI